MLYARVAIVPLLGLFLIQCPPIPVQVPTDVFTLQDEIVAVRARGRPGQLQKAVEIPLKRLRAKAAGDLEKVTLLHYRRGSVSEIQHRREEDKVIADLTGGETYLLIAEPTGRFLDTYAVLCSLERNRVLIDRIQPDLYQNICPLILCAPDLMRADELFTRFPQLEPLSERLDFGERQIGGWEPEGAVGVCERCTGLGRPGLIFPPQACRVRIPEGECTTVIFHDDFEADTVGNAPSTSPAGDPAGDALELQGLPKIVVIDSGPLGSKAAKIDRNGRAGFEPSVFSALPAGGPHTSGTYVVSFTGYSVLAGGDPWTPALSVYVRSSEGHDALRLVATTDSEYLLLSGTGTETLPVGFQVNIADTIEIQIDMDSRTFRLDINGVTIASNKPFLDANFADLRELRFEYPPTFLEALPATYVVDNIKICSSGHEVEALAPDLIIESLTHSPANPTTTDTITFTVVVKNIGGGTAGASTLELRVGGETVGERSSVPALEPGETFTAERQLVLDVAQNYRNTVTADVSNEVAESNEDNNQTTDDYTVAPAGSDEERVVLLRRLARKNLNIWVRIRDIQTWQKMIQADLTIPRSFPELRRLGETIFDLKGRRQFQPVESVRLVPGIVTRLFEECGESLYQRFFAGLGNPLLTANEREQIEADIDSDTPTFENSIETDHFILRWTNSSADAADNIADSTIIEDTAGYLEVAWEQYNTGFGSAPYVATGSTKIEVNFHDIGGYGVASPPDGPIQFDAPNWVNQPGIRQPTSAHELFHKLQYAFGYRTTWTPSSPYKWFSEGSASWAEVFVWQRVSGSYKVTDLFGNPDLNLYDASYKALPFWIFFQTRQQDSPTDNPLVSFLQKYDTSGDEEDSLAQVVGEEWPPGNVHAQLDNFFALFSRERLIGAWRQTPTGGQPYSTILDPNANNIDPVLTVTEILLGSGDSYVNTSLVSQLGSDYYRFSFASDTDGKTLTASFAGAATGDYSYYFVWEKDGAFTRAVFSPGVTGDHDFTETIDLGIADSLVIIVSGRGTGGTYTISVSVN